MNSKCHKNYVKANITAEELSDHFVSEPLEIEEILPGNIHEKPEDYIPDHLHGEMSFKFGFLLFY